jgi:hypothetical protein
MNGKLEKKTLTLLLSVTVSQESRKHQEGKKCLLKRYLEMSMVIQKNIVKMIGEWYW